MEIIKCPECGKEINKMVEFCPECGYPIKKKAQQEQRRIEYEQIKNEKKSVQYRRSKVKSSLIGITIAFAIMAGVFFLKGYNVKNNYYNSENFSRLNKNAYVGGDAYNYIINGTYFTGYLVIGSACMVSSVLLACGAVYVSMKEMEK